VHGVRWHENRVSRLYLFLGAFAEHDPVAFEHVNLVFPVVRMFRSVPVWRDVEKPHGEVLGAVVLFVYQPPHPYALCAGFLHAAALNLLVMYGFESQGQPSKAVYCLDMILRVFYLIMVLMVLAGELSREGTLVSG